MVAELFQFHCIHCASVATAISSASVQVGPSAFVLSSTYTAAVFALAFKHQSNMKSTTWLLFSCLFLAGLSKAISGKSSSSKKRPYGGDESSSSEDWASFSLGMHAQNLVPGTLAKKNGREGSKSWCYWSEAEGKEGKTPKQCKNFDEGLPQNSMAKLVLVQNPYEKQKDQYYGDGLALFPIAT